MVVVVGWGGTAIEVMVIVLELMMVVLLVVVEIMIERR